MKVLLMGTGRQGAFTAVRPCSTLAGSMVHVAAVSVGDRQDLAGSMRGSAIA
jgi:hypothetical protein